MRKPRVLSGAAAALLAATAMPLAHAGADEPTTHQDLAAARAATARYHDETRAVADGYTRTDDCVAVPGLGAMGYHYVNPSLLTAPPDIRKPPVLIYQPARGGRRELVAVEYFAADADQDLATDHDRPALFGVEFDGPMPGHDEGMPVHYDLHVWLWQHNPDGMFAQFNPTGRC